MKLPIILRQVSGHSMLPKFKPGAVVVARRILKQPTIGDAVIVRFAGKEMLKRIKSVKNDEVLLEGDNHNDSLDPGWVKRNDIVAKVVWPK